MSYKETTDKAAIIDTAYNWLPITKHTPRGKKIQLIREDRGVAVYGILDTDNSSGWTHWQALPSFNRTKE